MDFAEFTKINFGCGYDKRVGYLNIDMDSACNPDLLIVDSDYSKVPKDHFESIIANDVLEHIPRSDTVKILLDFSEFLAVGGSLELETSSILGVASQLAKSDKFADQFGWTKCLFGNQVHAGDIHYTGFTELTLRIHLLAAGFEVSEVWVHDLWLLSAVARKNNCWTAILEDKSLRSNKEFVQAAYGTVLHRDGDAQANVFTAVLDQNKMSRRELLRTLYTSEERLYCVASQIEA